MNYKTTIVNIVQRLELLIDSWTYKVHKTEVNYVNWKFNKAINKDFLQENSNKDIC